MKPVYKHDCSKCEFVGRFLLNPDRGYRKGKKVDVYKACDSLTGPSVIVRYSSEGSDYACTDAKYLGRYVTV